MKQIRVFSSTEIRDAVFKVVDYAILCKTEGVGIGIRHEVWRPDYSVPFYIDIRKNVTLDAVQGLQMSSDRENWSDIVAGDLPTGKTYFRVASDQTAPLKPNWTEGDSSDYDIGGNINSLVKVDFEEDNNCYLFFTSKTGFFQDKTKLKNAGKLVLPATTLIRSCYERMFDGCKSLIQAPELPAITLADRCYAGMFSLCTSLTQAPELPAITLTNSCYGSMFAGCASLVKSPELPAITLKTFCYNNMFSACTNLNYIKCLATDISALYCLQYWTRMVSPTGTFIKASGITYPTGQDGVPKNWTIEEI